jgi:hypothetical protein
MDVITGAVYTIPLTMALISRRRSNGACDMVP